jgi:hypothetical protein
MFCSANRRLSHRRLGPRPGACASWHTGSLYSGFFADVGCAAANTTALASYITPWQQYRNMILLGIIGIFAGHATIRNSAIGILALYFALYVLSLEPTLPGAGANCVSLFAGSGARFHTRLQFCTAARRLCRVLGLANLPRLLAERPSASGA